MPDLTKGVRALFNKGDGNTDTAVTAGRIRETWEASQKASAKERQAFWTNSAFLGNEQWVTWDVRSNVLIETPRTDDRLRRTENRLWPSSRTIIAKLLKRPLVFEVPPTAADDACQE